jgi:N12 class adenine-specific DNA methylase/adenine-specific DNA methylase
MALVKPSKTVSGISESKLHSLENNEATISNVLETDEGQLTFGYPDDNETTLKSSLMEQIPIPDKPVTENSTENLADTEPSLTPNVPEYLNLKIDYPENLIGVKVGDLFLFYGKDAEPAAAALETKVIKRDIPGLGFTSVTGYSGWADAGERLRRHGHNVTFAQPEGDGYEIIKSLRGEDYIPIGANFDIDSRLFEVESVDFDSDKVSLKDITFQNSAGFPISRVESIAFARSCWKEQQNSGYNSRMTFDAAVQDYMEEHKDEIEKQISSSSALKTNFRISETEPETGGQKTKYGCNVAAIRTLKQIESENRFATSDEQRILNGYVGWGGIPQAFDPKNSSWSKEYAELKDLLSDDEYTAARASVLTAFYTPTTVISAMYSTLERMGFKRGNIIDPGCGIGKFFGLVPDSMASSKLYGVELDSITGLIAKQLYQKSDITINGFEKTEFPDGFFDLSIGNVPFGGYKLVDHRYDKYNFFIHDYYFAKSLDKVRPGGLIAFITSKGTLDKQNADVRRYIAQRAELLGAVRLPNNTFLSSAGTEVTSDILFLQKRDRMSYDEPEWITLDKTDNGIPVNRYFAENPDMVLGTMEYYENMYGGEKDTACIPFENADLAKQLQEAMLHIKLPNQQAMEQDSLTESQEEPDYLPASPDVRNFSYTVVDGRIYYRENSRMNPARLSDTVSDRVRGMIDLRDCTRNLIGLQLSNAGDYEVHREQAQLDASYDQFTKKYGLINSTANKRAIEQDSSYCLLCSLEILDEDGNLERKADMFTKRTIKQATAVTAVDTPSEALAVSIGEKACVDLGYMGSLMGGSDKIPEIISGLQGVIFKNPKSENGPHVGWETADEYLSGNVRDKLKIARGAAEKNPTYAGNVAALEKVQPKELDASEIDVRLGATWVEPIIYKQFMAELFHTPKPFLVNEIDVLYSPISGEWNVRGKYFDSSDNVLVHVTYGTDRRNGYSILEDCLNLTQVKIFDVVTDAEGKEHRVPNKQETTLAQQKQEAIRQAFRDWIWQDPKRRETLCQKYNETFNSTRPREYDGQHIRFVGMNPEITLRPHQLNAVAHILYGRNVLLAHCVGAGKTFEMIAGTMESKRLGLTQKSLFVVPNHLTEQWGSDFLRLYPGANILVATKKDFEPQNRKKFCARIATGDYDAVIIGHTQFQKIPVSPERQAKMINEQIFDISEEIEQAKQEKGQNFTIKQMEKTKKNLEARLDKLNDTSKKDNVVNFEELGVDRILVDEADSFKNLFLYTKLRNVAGIGQTEAQKSSDMYMKCRYMDELTGGRGITFATGTPISNSMTVRP